MSVGAATSLREGGGEGRPGGAAEADCLVRRRVEDVLISGRAPQGGEGAAQHEAAGSAGGVLVWVGGESGAGGW